MRDDVTPCAAVADVQGEAFYGLFVVHADTREHLSHYVDVPLHVGGRAGGRSRACVYGRASGRVARRCKYPLGSPWVGCSGR